MRREILERKHVAGRQSDNCLGIAGAGEVAEAAQHRDEILNRPIVVDNDDERAVGVAAQQHEQQGFCRGRQSGDTNAPRALPQMGGYTREGGKHFYVREEFPDEGKKHANSILTGTSAEVWATSPSGCPIRRGFQRMSIRAAVTQGFSPGSVSETDPRLDVTPLRDEL